MATLTETAYVTRKGLNFLVILIVVAIIFRMVLGGATGLWQMLFPPPPTAPTLAFGKLPLPLAINNIATPSSAITYTLETPDGGLPVLPYAIRVYFMPKTTSSFGSFDRMKGVAGKLGFPAIPQRVSATTWRFVDSNNPLRTLDIDEVTLNFRVVNNFVSDQSLFNDKNFTSAEQAAGEARSYFEGLGILPSDFSGGQPIVSFYSFDAGSLVLTTAPANADAAGVTLTRAPIDSGIESLGKIPVVSPDFKQGLVSIILAGTRDSGKRILESRFLVAGVDKENWATYPPIPATQAFEKLQSGKAIFASLPQNLGGNITIRKVYPAYLDPYPSQSFLQPVMVFSDERGFVAYVPLIQ